MSQQGKGIVKSVLSGDTLILMGPSQGGPPPEKQISLSCVLSPRLARKGGQDEPFAWASREFLREKVIGKQVTFIVESVNPNSNRESGSVHFNGENLSKVMAAAGLAKLRAPGPNETKPDDYEDIVAAEAAAQSANKGMWDTTKSVMAANIRNIPSNEGLDCNALVDSLGKKPVKAIIERWRDGASFQCHLLPSNQFITVLLSGIQAPGIKRNDAGEELVQPFAREARFFAESRLLNREVNLVLEGVDKYKNFFATVIHPAGNIAEHLLEAGLVKVVEWSIGYCSQADRLRAAEKIAKEKRIRIWKDWTPPTSNSTAIVGRDFVGKIVEVVSGDLLMVQDGATTHKVGLSSIRVPRLGRRDDKAEPLAFESKDLLRTKFLGKKVNVKLEYSRPIPNNEREKERFFGTVSYDKSNLAEVLVEKGLATVVRHRQEDDRSSQYDQLLQAEARAISAGVGLHAKELPPVRHINDMSTSAAVAKAKAFLPLLSRKGRVPGICEYVMNGARIKVYIPRESCMVTVALSGVRCPATSRNDGTKGEEFGDAASAFTKDKCFQMDVEIEVDSCDRVGCFLGNVFVNKKNLASMLLSEGYAWLSGSKESDNNAHMREYVSCENSAKSERKRVWANYDEEAEAKAAAERENPIDKPTGPEIKVNVVEILDCTHFFVHLANDAEKLAELEKRMAAYGEAQNAKPANTDFKPKAGEICGAKFAADGLWYRAKVEKRNADGSCEVLFVDYGNSDLVALADIRPTDASFPSATSIPALAKEMKLAFLKAPKSENDDEMAFEAGAFMRELVWGKTLSAKVNYTDLKVQAVTLSDGTGVSVNSALLRAGLASINKRFARRAGPQVAAFQKDEDVARAARLNIFQYGDCYDSDEDEKKWTPNPPKK
jgi:staphylococcal nuclease domain-containing protein 1